MQISENGKTSSWCVGRKRVERLAKCVFCVYRHNSNDILGHWSVSNSEMYGPFTFAGTFAPLAADRRRRQQTHKSSRSTAKMARNKRQKGEKKWIWREKKQRMKMNIKELPPPLLPLKRKKTSSHKLERVCKSTSNMPNQSIVQRRPQLCAAQRAGEVFLLGTRVDSIQINFPWKQYQ